MNTDFHENQPVSHSPTDHREKKKYGYKHQLLHFWGFKDTTCVFTFELKYFPCLFFSESRFSCEI